MTVRTEVLSLQNEIGDLPARWNCLWERCRSAPAGCRAEQVLLFNRFFAPRARHLAITAWNGTRLAGVLPLNVARGRAWLKTASTPSNEWSQCGQMLVDPMEDPGGVIDAIGRGIGQLGVAALWMDWTCIDDRLARRLRSHARQQGWGVQSKASFEVGLIRLPESRAAWLESLSKNRRKKMRQELRELESAGPVELEVCSGMNSGELAERMEAAMAIEMQSWKGPAGSAIACNSLTREYFFRWAELLCQNGMLRLFFLRLNGERIAFDLGSLAHGTYVAQKVSFLESHARFSPGQALNGMVIGHLIDSGEARVVDTVGPMNDANQRWCNDTVRKGRMIVAPGSWIRNPPGRSLLTLMNMRSAMTGGPGAGLSSQSS